MDADGLAQARGERSRPTILVALDGSPSAERALLVAATIAERMAMSVTLVMVPPPEGRPDAERYLRDVGAALGITSWSTMVESDCPPAEAVLRAAEGVPGAVICMTSYARGSVGRAMLGSVAEDILCGSRVPVLLVGPSCATDTVSRDRGQLVVCTDGSELATAVLPVAAAWASRLGMAASFVEVTYRGGRLAR